MKDFDASACFDRIIKPITSILTRRAGATKEMVRTSCLTKRDAVHRVCTAHGISPNSFCGGPDDNQEGEGQGILNAGMNHALISVGDKDVSGRKMREEECRSLVDSVPTDIDGKVCARFMCYNDALFAYPDNFLRYDLVDVLRYMIEENIITPNMMISKEEENMRDRESLLYLAMENDSAKSFHYFLSLPSTDINAVASSTETPDFQYYDNIIHICLDSGVCPSYLKGVLADSNVLLNAQDSMGRTAFYHGCTKLVRVDNKITKLRLLLEAGADPRIENEDGYSPLSHIDRQIDTERRFPENPGNADLEMKLKSLHRDIVKRIEELNRLGE